MGSPAGGGKAWETRRPTENGPAVDAAGKPALIGISLASVAIGATGAGGARLVTGAQGDSTMEMQATAGTRGSTIHCLIALGLLVLAFRLADVSPSLAAGPRSERPDVAPWAADLVALDASLARQDLREAARHWDAAHVAARASGRWDGLVATGDAARRLGTISGARVTSESRSRRLYLAALFRARQVASVDGVLRVAAAFVELDDRDVVAQCVRVASELAARSADPNAERRVRAFAGQLAAK